MEVSEKRKAKGEGEGEEEEEGKMEGACGNPTVEEEYDMGHYGSSESEEEGKGEKNEFYLASCITCVHNTVLV